jgi:hypothetical protein
MAEKQNSDAAGKPVSGRTGPRLTNRMVTTPQPAPRSGSASQVTTRESGSRKPDRQRDSDG